MNQIFEPITELERPSIAEVAWLFWGLQLFTPLQLGNKDVLLRLLFLFSLTFGFIREEKELRSQQISTTQTVLLTGTFRSEKSESHTQNQEEQENLPFPPAFEKRYSISST